MLNAAMVEFTRKVLGVFEEEKVIEYVSPSMRELLGHLNRWSKAGKPDEDLRFWMAVEENTREITHGQIPGTLTYKIGEIVRELCNGILASDAIEHPLWAGSMVDKILSAVGDVFCQRLPETAGSMALRGSEIEVVLAMEAQKRAAITLLKASVELLMGLSVAE